MQEQQKKDLVAACHAAIAAGMQLSTPVEFYSKGCAGLVITLNHGRVVKDEGKGERRVDEVHAEFHKINSVKNTDGTTTRFGMYSTRNPKSVLTLLLRIEEKGDVIDSQTYHELATPKDILVNEARTRTLAAENELAVWIERNKEIEADKQRFADENEKLRRQVQELAAKPPVKGSQQAETAK